jgi:hypothetical protein
MDGPVWARGMYGRPRLGKRHKLIRHADLERSCIRYLCAAEFWPLATMGNADRVPSIAARWAAR